MYMDSIYCFGAIFGDGSTYIERKPGKTYVTWFSSRNRLLAEKIVFILRKSGYNPYFYPRFERNTFRWIVKMKNKAFYEDYHRFVQNINLLELSREKALAFIEGFFDTDGFIYEKACGFVNTNRNILEQIKKFLAKEGIGSTKIVVTHPKGDVAIINGVRSVYRKDVCNLIIVKDRKKLAKLLCLEA